MDDEVVADYHDCLLRKSDVELLNDSRWLNDNVIAFAFEYFEKEQFQDMADSIGFIGPHVAQCIKFMSALEVFGLLQSLELHTKNWIILPVNDNSRADCTGGSHWSLIVFSRSDKSCYHYDSMNQGNFEPARILWDSMKSLFQENVKLHPASTPQQENSHDCGVYVICIAEQLCNQWRKELTNSNNTSSSDQASKNAESCAESLSSITPAFVRQKRIQLKELIASIKKRNPAT